MTKYLVGVDEVGRGCLFGPVVAAAVILGNNNNFDLKDSKKLSEKKRIILLSEIERNAIKISIGQASVKEIDSLNIKEASLLAMERAILGLKVKNIEVIVDGIDIPKINYPCKAIIKADDKIPEVMAASIVAKVHRDKMMTKFAEVYPNYLFEKNKGYGTREHLDMLQKYGPCTIHRTTFNLGPKLLRQK